ncbi:glutaminyl-peptide cyclotransferase-like protein isoform X2 [Buteo buteo]|uniref:glutaminyl-peptide cyclotransferase-like protein isoform X2 n=1 Tax=Buteo buteo TaxID=30397 RepID=UPI003EBFC42A
MRKGPGGSRRARSAGSGPGPGPVAVPVPLPGPGLCPRSRRCPRPLLPLLALAAAAAALLYVAWPAGERGTGPVPPGPPSEQALRALLGQLDATRLRDTFLRPLLRERVPGGPGSRAARQHIMGCLGALGAAWHLELDAFEAVTPRGPVTFTNVVATVAPAAPRRLVLACHYDTKILPPGPGQQLFLGATDSAVPCAILLELAAALDQPLQRAKDRGAEVTLQLLFFDGEEAFGDWSVTDSLYGARHLAARMAATPHGPHGTQITTMSLLVLLDLLGARHPAIHSHFPRTHHWFLRLVAIEQRLRRLGLLHVLPQDQPFFRLSPAPGPVEDDHVPFLQRGDVPTSPLSPRAHCPPVPRDAPSPCPHAAWPGQGAGWAAGVPWADVPGDVPSHCVPPVSLQVSPCCTLSPRPSHVYGTRLRTPRTTCTPPPWKPCARSWLPSWPSSCSSEPCRYPSLPACTRWGLWAVLGAISKVLGDQCCVLCHHLPRGQLWGQGHMMDGDIWRQIIESPREHY